ncbi:histidine phosphatase family protein [soil metagenome]
MSALYYVTHPNVLVDPATPIEQWGLDATGTARATAMLEQPWIPAVERIVSSDETKALQTAQILAGQLALQVEVRSGIGENDRSSTGYLPPTEFERMADRFFDQPEQSADGWERAIDAQRRIVDGLADLLDGPADSPTPGVTVVVGHGAVGSLWYCWLTDQPISRTHDQPRQGHYFRVDPRRRSVPHGWRPIDQIEVGQSESPRSDDPRD